MAPRIVAAGASTFTPYDTGALKKVLRPADGSAVWNDEARSMHLAAHLGRGGDVAAFTGPYLAAHFDDPYEYVRRDQASQPDYPPYHGLVGGDRRGWTIEIQVHTDVELAPDGLLLEEIWLDGQDLLDEIPDDFRRISRIPPEGQPLEIAIARRIEEKLGGARG